MSEVARAIELSSVQLSHSVPTGIPVLRMGRGPCLGECDERMPSERAPLVCQRVVGGYIRGYTRVHGPLLMATLAFCARWPKLQTPALQSPAVYAGGAMRLCNPCCSTAPAELLLHTYPGASSAHP